MSDYQEAVQSPSFCFSDSELKAGTPVTNKLGLPRPICGQFASVYEIDTGKHHYAVKCFLRNIPNLHDRYAKISDHINRQKTPHFTTFEYQNDSIRVQGGLYPLVKMAWVKGLALNEFIEQNLSNPKVLLKLEARWLDLLEHLKGLEIAHGDLQHGNVLVAEDGRFRLIDYDGMWVPALQGQRSHEVGHPDFQSPLRTGKDFHQDIDEFAGAVIQIAIRALAKKPKLWERYNNGDNLLFRRQDYLKPSESTLISELKKIGDKVINEKLEVVLKACAPGVPTRQKRLKSMKGSPRTEKKPSRIEARRSAERTRATRRATPSKSPQQTRPTRRVPPSKPASAPRPRVPREPKAAAGQKVPGTSAGTPSWLQDHVAEQPVPRTKTETPPRPAGTRPSGTRPAGTRPAGTRPAGTRAASRSSTSTRRPSLFRVALNVYVLVSVAVPPVAEWMGFLSIQADSMTVLQWIVFGAAAYLGLLSLGSLFLSRDYHRKSSGRFFGFVALMSLYDMFHKLFTVGPPGSGDGTIGTYAPSAILFFLCMIGWLMRSASPTVSVRENRTP